MPLAFILVTYLLLARPADAPPSALRVTFRQTESQGTQAGNSSQQSSSTQSNTDQQKAPDQQHAAPVAPCPPSSQPGSNTQSNCKLADKTRKHHQSHKTTPAQPTPDGSPSKTIVRNGSTTDPTVDLSPGPNSGQTAQLKSTNDLLTTSDENLKTISGRQLTASQQDTVKQIKSYMEQAKTAANDGDVQRAHNLAVKANLLSAELAGH
jgi:hypothetical protein